MRPGRRVHLVIMACALPVLGPAPAAAQQMADPDFKPSVAQPTHTGANRPVVVLDEAHENFHTASGRYKPFVDLLTADGYTVVEGKQSFSAASLVGPRESGALGAHPITQGINRVAAFTGQSLSVPAGATALLQFGQSSYESAGNEVQADIAAFRSGTPHKGRSVTGRAQGVALEYGKGRVVVMGEAAMFSAQVARSTDPNGRVTETKMGMNVAGNDNGQFLLNIMKWLTRS